MEKKAVVFYGAGQNLSQNIYKWHTQGLIPDCIADRDFKKQHTTVPTPLGEVEILSLLEAIERCPDYEIWCTQSLGNLTMIRKYLINFGIPPNRIFFCEPYEWRKGCDELGTRYTKTPFEILSCCNNLKTRVNSGRNLGEDIKIHYKMCNQIINDVNNSAYSKCNVCPQLYEGVFPKQVIIKELNLSSNFSMDKCNLNCIYCSCAKTVGEKKGGSAFDTFYEFITSGITDRVLWNSGELTINPHCEDVLDMWLDKGLRGTICTNALIYNRNLAWVARYTETTLNVSIDAGTAESYAKIKNADVFNKVLNNINQYANYAKMIELKYIFLENYNDNDNDINGFLLFCCEISRKTSVRVLFSYDFNRPTMSENMRNFFVKSFKLSKRMGLDVSLAIGSLQANDYTELIRELE